MSPRILIFGTGSIGSVYTWVLSRQIPAKNIVCVCRSNYKAAKANGFTINSGLWGNDLHVNPTVVQTVEQAASVSDTPFDYAIVTSKVLNTTPSTPELLAPAITPEKTTIVLIQNGIGIEAPYSRLHPHNPLLSTVVYLPATQTSPGTTSHAEIEALHVGTYPTAAPAPHKASARAFTDLIRQCGATAHLHDDIQTERWSKLLVNATWNPICALTRSRDAELLKATPFTAGVADPDEQLAYIRDVMSEVAAIAQAYGHVAIDRSKVDFQIGRARKRELPGIEPSMLADARAGRRVEVDAIVGNALRMAREKGIETPMLRSLYVLLSGLDGSFARAAEEKERAGP